MKFKGKGFTIIELLVVVAIIGVLAGIAAVNLRESQKQARDARRKADLNTILAALTLYYNDNNTFSLAGCNCGYNNEGRGFFDDLYGGTSIANYLVLQKYLSSIVTDPSGDTDCGAAGGGNQCATNNKRPYMLHYDLTTGKKVTVYARMESTKSTVDVNNSCNTSPTIPEATGGYCSTSYDMDYALTAIK